MAPASTTTRSTRRAAILRGAGLLLAAALLVLGTADRATAAPVNLSKTAIDLNGGVVTAGDVLEYRITATNPAPGTVAGAVVRDVVPASTTYVAGSLTLDGLAQTDAPGDDGAYLDGGDAVFTLGNLPQGTPDRVMTFRVRIDPDTAAGVTIQNVATAQPGAVTSNTASTAVTVFPPVVVVSVTVTDLNGGAVQPDDVLRYAVLTRNVGTGLAAAVTTTGPIPAGTSYVPGTLGVDGVPQTDGSADDLAEVTGTAAVFRLGTGATPTQGGELASGGGQSTATFDVRVDADVRDGAGLTEIASTRFTRAGGTVISTASSAPLTILVSAPPSLVVDTTLVDVDGGAAEPGDVLISTVTVTNMGIGYARDVTVQAGVPIGARYVAGSLTIDGTAVTDATGDDGGEFAGTVVVARVGAGATAMAGGVIPPTTRITVRFRLTVADGTADGTVVAHQARAAYGGFADGAPRTAVSPIAQVVVTAPAPGVPTVLVTERFRIVHDADRDGRIGAGDLLQYTVTVANTGTGDATGIAFDQRIPSVTGVIGGSLVITRGTARLQAPGVIAVAIPFLPAHSSASLAYIVRVRPTLTSLSQLVTRSSTTTGARGAPAASPRLRITLRGPRRVPAGAVATYHVQIANLSRRHVRDLIVRPAVPSGLAVTGSSPRLVFTRSAPRWTVSRLRAGSSVTLVMRLRAARTARGARTVQVRLAGPTITPTTLRVPLAILPTAQRPPAVTG